MAKEQGLWPKETVVAKYYKTPLIALGISVAENNTTIYPLEGQHN